MSVKEYFLSGKEQFFPKPGHCPICNELSVCLIGWGFYFRNACDGAQWYRIPIKVFKCRRQARGGYLSIHPTFLLPYKQYSFSVIYGVLAGYFLLGLTMRESLHQVFHQDVFAFYQTMQHWIRDLKEGSGLWISLLQEEGRFSLKRSVSSLRAKELVHVMEVLRRYLSIQQKKDGEVLIPAFVLNRYRGSPLTTLRW